MAIEYSTDDVHPRDSLAYWVESVTRGFVKYAITTNGSAFRARVRAGELAGLGVADYECDAHALARDAKDISRAEDDDFFICLQLSGWCTHLQDERQAVLERGAFFLLDPRRPFTGRLEERGRMLTIKVPRHDLQARTGCTAALAAHTLGPQNPVAELAFGFLAMLPNCLDVLNEREAAKIAEQALDLVALAFSVETRSNGLTLSSPRAVALKLLKATIESLLRDPVLKPAGAAAAAGISVRYANALLAQEDTGLERYIIARRLERCRQDLADPAQAHRFISDIAFSWGFSDLSHFGRRFKAEFGCTPGEYRVKRNDTVESAEPSVR